MMTMENEQGYVYILTNPSFRTDWVKIGMSSRPVDIRANDLDNTAMPLPFEVFATLKTAKYRAVEKLIHKTIDRLTDLRIRQNREFFNIEPQVALDILRDVAEVLDNAEITEHWDENTPNDGELESRENESCVNSRRRPNFKFSMVDIPIGETLVFEPLGIEVKVATNDQIEYQERLYKLSPFVGTFMPDNTRCTSGAYQVAKFFTYNGRFLDDIRKEKELEQNDDYGDGELHNDQHTERDQTECGASIGD